MFDDSVSWAAGLKLVTVFQERANHSWEQGMELLGGQETPQEEGVVGGLQEHIWPTAGAPKGKPRALATW